MAIAGFAAIDFNAFHRRELRARAASAGAPAARAVAKLGSLGLRTRAGAAYTYALRDGALTIETRDNLKVRAETVEYEVKTEQARVTTPVSFERENIAGRADSASLDAKAKRLDLKGAVEITVSPEAGAAQPASGQPR